jgi:hypothetical protein
VVGVEVSGQGLKVTVTGQDAWLLAMRSSWETFVPLEHVKRAGVGKPVGLAVRRHSASKGSTMTCAQRTGPTVVIDLDGDPYIRMTLSVADPEDTVAAIKGALRGRS